MITSNWLKTGIFLAMITALFMGAGFLIAGQSGMMVAFIIALAMNFFSYYNSDKFVLKLYNAVAADENNYHDYYNIVSDLAQRAGLPQPKIYIIEDPQPNAFATGRNPQNAAVVATTGLLDRLDKHELAGVMAHELAHIEARDILTMTICATFAGALSMLGNFGFLFASSHQRSEEGGRGGSIIASLIAMILAPILAMLIQMAISRTREYSADERGGQICGNPLWLASALAKIANHNIAYNKNHGEESLAQEKYPQATKHMFIINPLLGLGGDNLFSTHPDTQNRINALEAQAQAMGISKAPRRPSWMKF